MNKYSNYIIWFLVWVLFLLVYKFGLSWLLSTEISYNMNWVEPRFIKKFRYTPINKISQSLTDDLNSQWDVYFDKISQLKYKIETVFAWLNINENIFVYIWDLWNYWFTIKVVWWKLSFVKWIPDWLVPTIILNIDKSNLDGLENILSDWNIDDSEKSRIASVVMKPMIERIYRLSRFYKVEDLWNYWFDDFMQFEIKGSEQANLKYTIVNVDGQWLVMRWFNWDPDIIFSMSLNDSLSFYKKITIDLENAQNKKEAILISKDIFDILKKNIKYVREDHK